MPNEKKPRFLDEAFDDDPNITSENVDMSVNDQTDLEDLDETNNETTDDKLDVEFEVLSPEQYLRAKDELKVKRDGKYDKVRNAILDLEPGGAIVLSLTTSKEVSSAVSVLRKYIKDNNLYCRIKIRGLKLIIERVAILPGQKI